MKVNKLKPHVLLLPEDDANRQLANGFCLSLPESTNIRVLDPSGGWIKVLDDFENDHVRAMQNNSFRNIVLLIDFDSHLERLETAKSRIPSNLEDRVFILGALNEPEDLRRAGLGKFEEIGSSLAKDCRENTDNVWAHEQLQRNASELARLREHVRPILFPAN
jgi:hypothetical protein